jgi:hypothetical protein
MDADKLYRQAVSSVRQLAGSVITLWLVVIKGAAMLPADNIPTCLAIILSNLQHSRLLPHTYLAHTIKRNDGNLRPL